MEKRLILAIGLSMLVLVVWSKIFPPPERPPAEPAGQSAGQTLDDIFLKAS